MLSGTLRISCITFPAFCRRSSSVFVSLGFLANVQAPNRSRPATTAKEFFAYFICAPPHALVFLFFVALIFSARGWTSQSSRFTESRRQQLPSQTQTEFAKALSFNYIGEVFSPDCTNLRNTQACRFCRVIEHL